MSDVDLSPGRSRPPSSVVGSESVVMDMGLSSDSVLIDGLCESDEEEEAECTGVAGCLTGGGALTVSGRRGRGETIECGVRGRWCQGAVETAERGEVARLSPSMGVPLREE